MGTLFVVATPIGNLKDVTLRALKTLQEADFILAEDTRVTRKLLSYHGIITPLVSYHQHSRESVMEKVFELLSQSKNLALVTDAGTPGVSDPGNELIAFLLSRNAETKVVPIPGPSALTAVASIAGAGMDKFLFLGYPPSKKGRKKFFQEVVLSPHPVIFYESPHRILKSLTELRALDASLRLVVGRELTKAFETVERGTIDEVLKKLQNSRVRGEFAVLVAKP
ncbi:MAG: 16S rRNA (cytidine(1402)-2'-O)-methyltransferase [bacterium]|nr:16S rRNA (cytidine(1402)-2'-O)-methyltransferase [bacterium]